MNNERKKVKAYWDREAPTFDAIYSHNKSWLGNLLDATFRWDMYKRFEYAIEQAEPIENRSFLDVGCGTGRYVLELARRGASKVVGIDISQSMLDLARQRAETERLDSRCIFLHGDFPDVTLGLTFDITLAIGLFDYVENPAVLLTKMRESTRHKVIMSFPRLWTWRAPVRRIRLGFKGSQVFFYTAARINRLLRQAGYRSHSMNRIGTLYCVSANV